jgi:ornithine cyclodeaminase/alanine dehydrogenase
MTKIKVLSREDVKKVLKLNNVIESVITVYRKKSEKRAESWPTVFYDFEQGKADLDIKSGYIQDIGIFGHKITSLFEGNVEKNLHSLNSLIIVFDSETGIPEGIVEGSYITGMRTGAAGAIGAKLLSRPGSENLMILGAGSQAFFQVGAALTMLPQIKNVRIVDVFYPDNAKRFVDGISERLF